MGIEDRACAEDILRRMPIEEYKQLVIDQGLKPDYDADRATHYAQEAAKIKGAAKEEFEDAHGNPAPKSAPDTDPTPPPSTDPVVRMA